MWGTWTRGIGAVGLAALVCGWPLTVAAHGEVRSATATTKSSTPTIALNVRSLQVSVDTATGTGTLRVQFWTPVPEQTTPVFGNTLTIDMVASESACGGEGRSQQVGDLHLFVSGRSDYSAAVTVKFRPDGPAPRVPATLNPERTELTATFTDELLRESDLRCLTWRTTGRAQWDPRLPGGGPALLGRSRGVWADGLRPAFKLKLRGPRRQRTNPYSFPAVKFGARCSLACTLQVRGHVTTPGGKRIRGVRIRTDHTLARADWRFISHSFRGAEEARRVKEALARHGRLRVQLRTQARDADGRRSAARRVVTLRGA